MKALLLILIPIMFFITSCEDVDELSSTGSLSKFSKVENLLFAYSERSENKYLVIRDSDIISQQLEVLTYEEISSNDRRNEILTIYTCNSEDCRTDEVDSKYNKIKLLDDSTRIVISRHEVQNDGRDDLTTSSSSYDLIED